MVAGLHVYCTSIPNILCFHAHVLVNKSDKDMSTQDRRLALCTVHTSSSSSSAALCDVSQSLDTRMHTSYVNTHTHTHTLPHLGWNECRHRRKRRSMSMRHLFQTTFCSASWVREPYSCASDWRDPFSNTLSSLLLSVDAKDVYMKLQVPQWKSHSCA